MAEEIKADTAKPPKAENPKPKAGAGIDIASIGGLALALGGILGGLLIEGGRLKDVAQFTAAMIVLGGTIGAVMISTPLPIVIGAAKRFAGVFRDNNKPMNEMLELVIGYATKARKNGLVSLEHEAEQIQDPFLKKALNLAVDGTDLQELRKMLELEMEIEEQHLEAEAKVFESAGGYAPTVGIIGAVLGLIQVMKNLANIEEVGHGIAVAFVATVYGVGTANLLFLPAASKIKARFTQEMHRKELIIEAVSGIVEGLNPKLIRMKLEAFAPPEPAKKPAAVKEKAGAAREKPDPVKA
ncbi:MAG TPA: flagellar motor protein [Bryobacteraceae bacterium]|jgi:chemotaxis protein MotA|nr:flagellar motor protein [Bryobacteraceae bacterium]